MNLVEKVYIMTVAISAEEGEVAARFDVDSIQDETCSHSELLCVDSLLPKTVLAGSKEDTICRMNAEVAYQSNIREVVKKEKQKHDREFYELYNKYANWTETPGWNVLIPDHAQVSPHAPVLVKAVANHDYHAVEVFLENGADPQIKGWQVQSRATPITLAITDDDKKMIELLLQYLPDDCDPCEDLFIANALQMCTLPALKLLFEKGGGVKNYLQRSIQRSNETEIRIYNHRLIRFKRLQKIETPYGKCSKNTIESLNHVLLATTIRNKERSFEVVEYLLQEGWFPGDSQTFNAFLDRDAPLSVFQKLLENGCPSVCPVFADYPKRNRVDVLRLVVEARPTFLKDLNNQVNVGIFLAKQHDYENYKYCFDMGMKPFTCHVRAAISNKGKLKSDKKGYLLFIQKLLDLGVDPNCLPDAKSTGCNELVELLLEYGARPV